MHTDPNDNEGPNLFKTAEQFKVQDTIFFSKDRLEFDKMNVLYNISDFCLNISYAEGFGLSTLEAMMTGTPIIAVKTGGLTRQVVDHRDGTENGVALDVDMKTLVGSQTVPFIYEDYCKNENVANGIYKLFSLSKEERDQLSNKVYDYATTQFSYEEMIDSWHNSLLKIHKEWKENYVRITQATL